MKLKIKKINPCAVMPVRATEYSAGADLFACIENPITLKKGETVKISSGCTLEYSSTDKCVRFVFN